MIETTDTLTHGTTEAEKSASSLPAEEELTSKDTYESRGAENEDANAIESKDEDNASTKETKADEGRSDAPDYTADLSAICELFPEILGSDAIGAVRSPRYAELRELGLTPSEAYLATGRKSARQDNRSHLVTSVPKGSGAPAGGMTDRELIEARRLFGDLSDSEIKKLFNKVTK